MEMKKKCYLSGMLLAGVLAFGTTAFAAETESLTFTDRDELLFSNQGGGLKMAWADMAPGDTKTVVIRLENKNSHPTSFYLSQETTDILEDLNRSAGGAYEYSITVGKTPENTQNLLDAVAGGYSEELEASTTGLADFTQLNQYQYIAELAPGEETNLYLTLTLDGEGLDSANGIDYSNADGELFLQFLAYYEEDDHPVIVPENQTSGTVAGQITNSISPVIKTVKTGDVPVLAAVLSGAAGAGLIVLVLLRKQLWKRKRMEGANGSRSEQDW